MSMKNCVPVRMRQMITGMICANLAVAIAGCDRNELRALVAGLEAATSQLEQDDDISFSDWLRSELDD